jgi:hypothetical protein
MEIWFRLGSCFKDIFHLNADLVLLGSPSQATSSGAGQTDYSVYNGTCESLEKGDGMGGQTVVGTNRLELLAEKK